MAFLTALCAMLLSPQHLATTRAHQIILPWGLRRASTGVIDSRFVARLAGLSTKVMHVGLLQLVDDLSVESPGLVRVDLSSLTGGVRGAHPDTAFNH